MKNRRVRGYDGFTCGVKTLDVPVWRCSKLKESADASLRDAADAAARRDRGYRKGVPIELVIITVQDPAGQGQIVAEAVLNAAI